MKTSKKQLAYVRDWERRNPEAAQARKNKYWKTAKGKAAMKRRQEKHNEYRRLWRARKKAEKLESESATKPKTKSSV